MGRNFGRKGVHKDNVPKLVKALLILASDSSKSEDVQAQWNLYNDNDLRLRVSGRTIKVTKKAEQEFEGTTLLDLWKLAENTDNCLEFPKRRKENSNTNIDTLKTNAVQNVINYLDDLKVLHDERLDNVNEGIWIFSLELNKNDSLEENLRFIEQKLGITSHSNTVSFSLPLEFQALIDHKIRYFEGREYVFSAINEFISCKPKGYFTIEGDPGIGKSAILAKYVQDTGCVAYFNVKQIGRNLSKQFIESIYQQLNERYKLPDSLPTDEEEYSIFLGRILNEVAQKRNGKNIVIAIDALDEVDSSKQVKGKNILYLPVYLPEGIYFITTVRRDAKIDLYTESPQKILNLMEYKEENRKDACSYICTRVNNSESLRKWIDYQSLTQEYFINKITELSENNFMYLLYVLPDIENNKYCDLNINDLPIGLQNYYKFHCQRMGLYEDIIKLKVVFHLAESHRAISCQLISEYIGVDIPTVEEILKEWLQFLHMSHIEKIDYYNVYHRSFTDFLREDERVKKAGISSRDIIKQKTDYLMLIIKGDID